MTVALFLNALSTLPLITLKLLEIDKKLVDIWSILVTANENVLAIYDCGFKKYESGLNVVVVFGVCEVVCGGNVKGDVGGWVNSGEGIDVGGITGDSVGRITGISIGGITGISIGDSCAASVWTWGGGWGEITIGGSTGGYMSMIGAKLINENLN